MSEIKMPGRPGESKWSKDIETVSDLIGNIELWHEKRNVSKEGRSLSRIWYRGNPKAFLGPLQPKVDRQAFTEKAEKFFAPKPDAKPPLTLERMLLKEFRMASAVHFDANDVVEVYFIAQHFGMPTRLLDWTMNPLIGLFFTVNDRKYWGEDGELYVMDALKVLPDTTGKDPAAVLHIPTGILTMRDERVQDTIGVSFWIRPFMVTTYTGPPPGIDDIPPPGIGLILPVRPDNRPGRIGQQSSCFTLHEVGSLDRHNLTLDKFVVKAGAKERLLNDLRRLNINEYTIFNDLDRLSSTICCSWDIGDN